MKTAHISKAAKVTINYSDGEVYVIKPTCIAVNKTVEPWGTVINTVTFEWTDEPDKAKAKRRKKT